MKMREISRERDVKGSVNACEDGVFEYFDRSRAGGLDEGLKTGFECS
jgi:hypothetical protein